MYSIAAVNIKTGQRLRMPVRSKASREQLKHEVDCMNGVPSIIFSANYTMPLETMYNAKPSRANRKFMYILTTEPEIVPQDLGGVS